MPLSAATELAFLAVDQHHLLAAPLLADLAREYAVRYDGDEAGIHRWLTAYPAEQFAPPHGGLLVGLLDGRAVTGGAFRRFDGRTAELKRIWTAAPHRRRGLAGALLAQLEAAIAAAGYRRVYLTTGDRQPEAVALYLRHGYTRLAAPLPADSEETYPVAFLKELP